MSACHHKGALKLAKAEIRWKYLYWQFYVNKKNNLAKLNEILCCFLYSGMNGQTFYKRTYARICLGTSWLTGTPALTTVLSIIHCLTIKKAHLSNIPT